MGVRCLVSLTLLAWLLVHEVSAQPAPYCPPPGPLPQAINGTAPLLYARFLGLDGMDVTFYRGNPRGNRFPMPVTVGLRAGYVYRVELGNLPNHPGMSLFPTLEVIGTLRLGPRVRAIQFPAPILFTSDDVEQVLTGAMITKVVYLEHPDNAAPVSGDPDVPVETAVSASRDLLREASDVGRPLVILRLGQRELTREEVARQGVPGTILLPGETHLSLPRQPPVVPPVTWQWYDPLLGPRKPEEECVRNGYVNPNRNLRAGIGDRANFPGINNDGQLAGLRAEDTVAEFKDSSGRTGLVVSNRVCLVAPRFGLFRNELPLNQVDGVTNVVGRGSVTGQDLLRGRNGPSAALSREILAGSRGRERPSGLVSKNGLHGFERLETLQADLINIGTGALLGTEALARLSDVERLQLNRQMAFARALSQAERLSGLQAHEGTSVVGRVENGPEVIRATTETSDLTSLVAQCAPQTFGKALTLFKWADRESAKVGDVVTFFLRYGNHGQRPLTDVAVSDSLSTRLEYVPGSSQSSRPALFTMQENEAGSKILRWEITGSLQHGDSGVIRFQVRVR